MPSSRCSLPLLAALLATGGCSKEDKIDVVEEEEGVDFGRSELLEAVEKAGKSPKSPEAYRELAETVKRLEPKFNEEISRVAERNLAFLAIGPMEAHVAQPPEEQAEALALTVWPTAFRVEPEEGESVRAYLERLCSGEMASECKYVVPEHWPLVLGARAWRRMKERAREAYTSCSFCEGDPGYEDILDRYSEHAAEVAAELAKAEERIGHSAWPEAGERARPRSETPVLALNREGEAYLNGERSSNWRRAIAQSRDGHEVLGVHLWPAEQVRVLRSLLEDAAEAGYREVALEVRLREFPYELREYRLKTSRRRGPGVEVRDVDPIQVLVSALDVAAGGAGEQASFVLKR